MELIRKSPARRVKNLAAKIYDDNLFLLSSSVSYYSALGLAPFFLIVLYVSAFVGETTRLRIVQQAALIFSPQVGDMIRLIFMNARQGINIGSMTGIAGALVLLFTASLVFLQFRFAFDTIYGHFSPEVTRPVRYMILERIFAMITVIISAALFIVSFSITAFVDELFGEYSYLVLLANFLLYVLMFAGLHYFAPSRRPRKRHAFKMAALSAVFFMIGNVLLASYMKKVAATSVYGAAGTLLVFLVWTFYSAFTVFLSVEVFLYLKKIGKIR
ncbi:MAG: YihY/virulence factor BrkB family protein [Bacteriovoracaceae bacterium]